MNTKNSTLDIIILVVLIFAPAIILLFFWSDLPEEIAVHFSFDGAPNRMESKLTTLISLTLINAFTLLIINFTPKIDPKWRTNNYSEKTIGLIKLFTGGIMIAVTAAIVAQNIEMKIDMYNMSIFILISTFFFLGNYMGKFKPNYFIGIRTPWTLESEEVWYKTHRFGGYVFVLGSLAMTFILFFVSKQMGSITIITTSLLLPIIPIIYSYIEYQKLTRNHTGK